MHPFPYNVMYFTLCALKYVWMDEINLNSIQFDSIQVILYQWSDSVRTIILYFTFSMIINYTAFLGVCNKRSKTPEVPNKTHNMHHLRLNEWPQL